MTITCKRRSAAWQVLAAVGTAALLAACGSSGSSGSNNGSSGGSSGVNVASIDQQLKKLSTTLPGSGPNGMTPSPPSSVQVTPAEVAKLRSMNATAAIAMHYFGDTWSLSEARGLRHYLPQFGVKVTNVTNANFDAPTQLKDLEAITNEHPDALVSIPVDAKADAAGYKAASQAGIKVIFMDNVATGMKPGSAKGDFVTDVSSDDYGDGEASALVMAKFLHGKGDVGVVFYDADFFATNQRLAGFLHAIKQFPGIHIVAKKGFLGSDLVGSAETNANALFTQYPNLSAIWVPWSVPMQGVLTAASSDGKSNFIVTDASGLSTYTAKQVATGKIVVGGGAQNPWGMAKLEAKATALAILGKKVPPFLELPSIPYTRANLASVYQKSNGQPLPAADAAALKNQS